MKYLTYILASLLLFIVAFGSSHHIFAQTGYSRTYDGGEIGQVKEYCTCSGGMLIEFDSYVDDQDHEYVYQYGVTQLYQNYNIMTQGAYFLSTHFPFGICLVVVGNSCESEGNPEGTLIMIGTS